jgi:PIG-X / PBN1
MTIINGHSDLLSVGPPTFCSSIIMSVFQRKTTARTGSCSATGSALPHTTILATCLLVVSASLMGFSIGVFSADVVPPQHIQNDDNVNINILVKVQAIPLHEPLSSSSLSSSEEDLNVWHFTCFLVPESGYTAGMDRLDDDEQERRLCCQQILTSIIVEEEGGGAEYNEYCHHHLARVPDKTLLQRGVEKEVVRTTVASVKRSSSANYPLALADYSLLLRIGGRSKVLPSVRVVASPWWSSSSSSETIVDHENRTMEEMDNEATSQEDHDKSINLLTANVSSRLSTDGGMHRELHHVVTVEYPPVSADENESDEPQTVATGTLYLLLVLPEDFFMDMDDPVVGGAVQDCGNSVLGLGGCTIHYFLVEHDLVDIEQPAFDSPQHVVGIKLSFQHPLLLQDDAKDSSSSFLSLQFTTKIHTRYPVPVGGGFHQESTSSLARRKRIGLPAPGIIGGNWQVRKKDLDPIVVWFLQEAEVVADSAANQQWLSTTVAAGSDGDYPWVILGTLMCCLIGAALTMRDLALVSIWDAT